MMPRTVAAVAAVVAAAAAVEAKTGHQTHHAAVAAVAAVAPPTHATTQLMSMKDDACTNEQSELEQQESRCSHTLVTHTISSFPLNTTTTATTTTATTTTATTTTADAHPLPNWKVQSAREKAFKIYEQQIGTERTQISGNIAPAEKAKSLISKLPFGKKDRFVFSSSLFFYFVFFRLL